MITYYPSQERHTNDHGWLLTRLSFSFADYYDPENVSFGVLRVFNDDIVQPGQGFGMHPHRNMEIVSYVIEGTLEHRDSMGNIGRIEAGELQRISAGTGILHSEYNPSDNKPVHFLQMWIMPNEKNTTPSWEQRHFSLAEQKNKLLPVVSGDLLENTLQIRQDATFYLSTLEADQVLTHQGNSMNNYFLFCIKGKLTLNGQTTLSPGDSVRITNTDELQLKSLEHCQFLMIDMVQTQE